MEGPRLIKGLPKWIDSDQGEDFLSQFLSDNRYYLYKFKSKKNNTQEYTFFQCIRYHGINRQVNIELDVYIKVENRIEVMLRGKTECNTVNEFVCEILTSKDEEERRMMVVGTTENCVIGNIYGCKSRVLVGRSHTLFMCVAHMFVHENFPSFKKRTVTVASF